MMKYQLFVYSLFLLAKYPNDSLKCFTQNVHILVVSVGNL